MNDAHRPSGGKPDLNRIAPPASAPAAIKGRAMACPDCDALARTVERQRVALNEMSEFYRVAQMNAATDSEAIAALTANLDEAVELMRRWWHWHPSDIPLGNETQDLLARLAPPAEKPSRQTE